MTRELSTNYLVNGFPWWGTREDISLEVASEASTGHPLFFVKLEFDSADVNFHSGIGDITWGGDTYTGTGAIGAITGIEETGDLARTPISLSLSGLPTALLSVILAEQYQGRTATVYMGYRDMTTYRLVADPVILYRGLMDSPNIEQSKTLSITLSVESRFAQWDRPRVRRYTNEDQRARYSADTGLQTVEQSTDKPIIWGAKSP